MGSQQSEESPNSPSEASQGSNLENVLSVSREGENFEKAPTESMTKEDSTENLKGSIAEKKSEVVESENGQPNKSPDEAKDLSGDQVERLPAEATEDDLSLAQMMEEMEEDEMESEEEVKKPSKQQENIVISLDQIMDQMEED